MRTPGIVIDARGGELVIADETTGQVAITADTGAMADIVSGFGGPDLHAATQDEDPGPYRDSGDEDPHA